MEKALQLYISVPFCPQRCAHCRKRIWRYDQTVLRGYGAALEREIEAAGAGMEDYTVRSVCFGGGAPPVLTARVLRRLLAAVRRYFRTAPDMDVEVEALPANFTQPLCGGMAHDGLTHILCGLGTVHRREWALLNRPYDYGLSMERLTQALQTRRPPHLTMKALYGIPGQTESGLAVTLERILTWKPDCVRLDPLPPDFAPPDGDKKYAPLSFEAREGLLRFAQARLAEAGYRRYSLRDYALPGRENRFETDRLRDADRLGLGLGAASHYDGVFYANTTDLVRYLDHSAELEAVATNITAPNEAYLARRRALLALSTPEGLPETGLSEELAAFARAQAAAGNIVREDGRLRLTAAGLLRWEEIILVV